MQHNLLFCLRFKLTKWATGDLDSEATVRAEEFVEHCNGLAEHWLALVIAMAGERSVWRRVWKYAV